MASTSFLTLVVGGVRSGKSSLGEKLVLEAAGPHFYLATAQVDPSDAEMVDRVRRHRERRAAQGWFATIEESFAIEDVFRSAPKGSSWLLECLPLWLAANAFPPSGELRDEEWVYLRSRTLVDIWKERNLRVVAISAEAGMGLMPMDKVGRRWIDLLGRMNQTLAAQANEVWFCSCGIPLRIKGDNQH